MRKQYAPPTVKMFEVKEITYNNDEQLPFRLQHLMSSTYFPKALDSLSDNDKTRKMYFVAFMEASGTSLEILCVYAFWLVVARWLPEKVHLGKEFTAKLKSEFNKAELQIYWYFLNEIKAKWRDKLMDMKLIFIA